MVLTVQMNGCNDPLTATVTLESSLTPMKWSHTFEDGEKVGFPVPPGVASNIFFKAELKEKNATIQFKVKPSS